MLLGNLFIHPIAELLRATPYIHNEAVSYLRYIVIFAPFLLFSFLLGGLVRKDGRPKLAMFALTFGSVSNMVLDYVFMYPLNMGIGGAALATALGAYLQRTDPAAPLLSGERESSRHTLPGGTAPGSKDFILGHPVIYYGVFHRHGDLCL